ncbi:GerAB/ArcD/ProY family transporter [Bacillus sp. AFS055030]|uniref:GerAB/ArcD/ProY family transporter n=1 Tax=Bacillus sp. AFS055030 TaxID=2033507 RepID=UPI000BFCA6A1|nr:GerAB/ArcD/ProY family transporter [Bacillus sp. AFS055030]PGL73226.1 spore gernimation protein KB [Bacillus sp. AFS055030]
MKKMKFNSEQLFSLMTIFLIGTAGFLEPAKSAKQDSWIAILISLLCGLLLYRIYMAIYHNDPSSSLIKFLQIAWGKYLGGFVGLIYIIYCIYIAARVLRDFSEVISTVALEMTTIFTITILMMFLLIYTVIKGFTTFARTVWICFLFTSAIITLLLFCQLIAGFFSLDRLRPVLENGWSPVLHTVFPTTISLPFGEVVVFLLLMHHFDRPHKSTKVGSFAIVTAGIFLATSSIIHLGNLGVDLIEASNFPVLSSVSLINIGDFFTRLESLAVISFVILGFIKISVFFFGAVSGTVELFHLQHHQLITFFIGIIILFFSYFGTGSYFEHEKIGFEIIPKYVHVPLQIIIPILLLITINLQKKFSFS